ncbi:MAG: 4'-phosphopantetheinyl transferase superfamily protein [Chitinivibrionales bacterium]|nr:4'-phosphopantetheinyl transferase superfamily protein [Chitinivibrionales bacterium]
MGTISLQFRFSSPRSPTSCGVDIERTARFDRYSPHDEHHLPFVFSVREMYFYRSLAKPSVGMCASFCCKEAFFKALGEPYHFPECELFYRGTNGTHPVTIAEPLRKAFDIKDAVAAVREGSPSAEELLVAVYLF